MSLEGRILNLARYGTVRVGQYGTGHNGWHACLELFVTGKGVKMEINSDFKHTTPTEAVACLEERLKAALEEMAETSQHGPKVPPQPTLEG